MQRRCYQNKGLLKARSSCLVLARLACSSDILKQKVMLIVCVRLCQKQPGWHNDSVLHSKTDKGKKLVLQTKHFKDFFRSVVFWQELQQIYLLWTLAFATLQPFTYIIKLYNTLKTSVSVSLYSVHVKHCSAKHFQATKSECMHSLRMLANQKYEPVNT